jgi:oxaloacetate decarboxylase (Na+ extruding) subunit alpha
VINLIYSVSPKHADEYFAQRTREAASLKVKRLCLKDPGGLLTPERVKTLVPIIFQNADGIPVELHTHCTTGLGPLCCLEAVNLGIKIVNTALPPLADGSSNPSLFNVAKNLRALGYKTLIDEQLLKPVSEHFTYIAKREGFPIGTPVEYDYSQYQHQVPGGMISNLRHQLRKVGMEQKIDQALEETMRVRAELGYPIMVTPLSQFVGSQAAINVIVGERYKEVTDQIIQYTLGYWGREGAELMDANVKEKILDRPRAREWAEWRPPEPTIQEIRKKMNAEGVSDEELLLRWNLNVDEIETMKAAGAPRNYLTARQPLLNLLDALSRRSNYRQIVVQKGEILISLQKGSSAA